MQLLYKKVLCELQWCGSGSARIRITGDLLDPYPDPDPEVKNAENAPIKCQKLGKTMKIFFTFKIDLIKWNTVKTRNKYCSFQLTLYDLVNFGSPGSGSASGSGAGSLPCESRIPIRISFAVPPTRIHITDSWFFLDIVKWVKNGEINTFFMSVVSGILLLYFYIIKCSDWRVKQETKQHRLKFWLTNNGQIC